MAQLTYSITRDGLVAGVLVNLEMPLLIPLRLSGRGPSPVVGSGLFDTGSDITGISLPILQGLGVFPVGQAITQSVSGSMPVRLYRVSLHLYDSGNASRVWMTHPSLIVMELDPAIPFDVLIGMDVLRTCRTLIDGPANLFTIEF